MRSKDIVVGAEVYYAAGEYWLVLPPKRAIVVDPGPYRISRVRQGAFYTVQPVRDDAGSAVLVRIDGETIDRAVPRRDLRGLWLETLAATGRTVAGVKAHDAAVAELGATREPLGVDDLLRLAACDEGLNDDVFTTMTSAIEGD